MLPKTATLALAKEQLGTHKKSHIHQPTNQPNTNNGIEKNRHTLGKQKPKEKHNLTNNLEKQE